MIDEIDQYGLTAYEVLKSREAIPQVVLQHFLQQKFR